MRGDTSAPSTITTTTTTTTTSPTSTTTTTSSSSSPSSRFLLSPPARTRPKTGQTTSLSQALSKLTAGPSRADFLKGPVSEGFSTTTTPISTSWDPSTRWIGPGARTAAETPPTGTRGGLFSTHNTATTSRGDDYYFTYHTQQRGQGSFARHHHHHHHPQRRLSKRDSSNHAFLPPLSDGVPSRGLFSKTKGHLPYHPTVSERAVFPDNNTMSERLGVHNGATTAPTEYKETGADHLDEASSSSEVGAVSKRSKVKRHCAKWWWVHLLIFIALTVLIVCLM